MKRVVGFLVVLVLGFSSFQSRAAQQDQATCLHPELARRILRIEERRTQARNQLELQQTMLDEQLKIQGWINAGSRFAKVAFVVDSAIIAATAGVGVVAALETSTAATLLGAHRAAAWALMAESSSEFVPVVRAIEATLFLAVTGYTGAIADTKAVADAASSRGLPPIDGKLILADPEPVFAGFRGAHAILGQFTESKIRELETTGAWYHLGSDEMNEMEMRITEHEAHVAMYEGELKYLSELQSRMSLVCATINASL